MDSNKLDIEAVTRAIGVMLNFGCGLLLCSQSTFTIVAAGQVTTITSALQSETESHRSMRCLF